MSARPTLRRRLTDLEARLKAESPDRLPLLAAARDLDRTLRRPGFLRPDESLATRVPWWPVVAVLGTAGSGKSTCINRLLGAPIPPVADGEVGAVTLLAHGTTPPEPADPRLPPALPVGEGGLRLAAADSDALKGLVVIDTPGFDGAHDMPPGLVEAVIGAADLVLVFFDACHPDPPAIRSTLHRLVPGCRSKVVCVLNKIDACATDDDVETLVGVWKEVLAQAGLVEGIYEVYDAESAGPDAPLLADAGRRARFAARCAAQFAEIRARIDAARDDRTGRIRALLAGAAAAAEGEQVPLVRRALRRWRRRVLLADVLWLGLLAALAAGAVHLAGTATLPPFLSWLVEARPAWARGVPIRLVGVFAVVAGLLAAGHLWLRAAAAQAIAAGLPERAGDAGLDPRRAFRRATRVFRSLFRADPVGWGRRAARRVAAVREALAARA
ncbi:MAG TPA: GTPase [Azospirillum sp.]|nr:GTPase [Azospirillum sp.]